VEGRQWLDSTEYIHPVVYVHWSTGVLARTEQIGSAYTNILLHRTFL